MTRRFLTTVAFAAAAAFALAMATPAQACDGHKQTADTQKKSDKATPKASSKGDKAPAVQDKKADASAPASTLLAAACNCDKDGKNCTCPKGECKCPNCHQEKPKARAA
jgi:hypothetical protein